MRLPRSHLRGFEAFLFVLEVNRDPTFIEKLNKNSMFCKSGKPLILFVYAVFRGGGPLQKLKFFISFSGLLFEFPFEDGPRGLLKDFFNFGRVLRSAEGSEM